MENRTLKNEGEGNPSGFCQDVPFWSNNITWFTEQPHFTTCFEFTVLSYTPAFLLLLLLPLELITFTKSQARGVPWDLGIKLRLAITLLLLGLGMVEIFAVGYYEEESAAEWVGPTVKTVGVFVSAGMLLAARHFGKVSSGPQFIYWLMSSLCQGLVLGSRIMAGEAGEVAGNDQFQKVIISLSFGLSLMMVVLNCWSDRPPVYADLSRQLTDNPCPKMTASFPSKMLYDWFTGLIVRGWKKPLTRSDMWGLNPEDSYEEIVPRWESYLHPTMEDSGVGSRDKVSILWPLVRCFGHQYFAAVLFRLCSIGFILVNPQLIDLFISYVEENQENWKGYLYMVLLGLNTFMIAIGGTGYWNQVEVLSMRVFTAISSSIYKKSLNLSSSGRNEYTVGQIVNLIAVDAEKVKEAVMFVTFMWASPLQVALTVYFIWQVIGPAALVGFSVFFLCIPLNGLAWYGMQMYQKRQMGQKDERVNLINEILNGIKVLKMYAWEKSFLEKIGEIRTKEIDNLKWLMYLESSQYMMFNSMPFLVALSSFTAFILMDPNNVLDAKTAFVSLSLFNSLQAPMWQMPYGIVSIIQGMVSIKRINSFLNTTEIDPTSVGHDRMADGLSPIIMKNASFSWGTSTCSPVIRDINLLVGKGQLVAVVGQVGSGKSSLISALLGEMTRTKGFANLEGSVAYVSQQAWLRNMSLKDNILFSKAFSGELYEKVLETCALQADLAQFPAGDSTEIGEKGINLSGGQKQRINLARSVYANKDLYLLDDPLSAVDSHVGKHIFDKVIGPKGVLRKKTRLLVTHGISFLPQVDKIVVLKEGRVVECGGYYDLLDKKGDFANFILEQLQGDEEDEEKKDDKDTQQIWQNLKEKLGPEELSRRSKLISCSSSTKSPSHPPRTSSIGAISDTEISSVPESLIKSSSSVFQRIHSSVGGRGMEGAAALVEEEHVEETGVKYEIYVYYIQAFGVLLFLGGLLFYGLFQASSVGSNILLTQWSNDEAASNNTVLRNSYLTGYGVLGAMQSLFVFLAIILVTFGNIRASIKLHNQLLSKILRAPMSFFDTVPTGRIVNRFAKDIDAVDINLPGDIKNVMNEIFTTLGLIFAICFVSPILLLLIVPLVIVFFFIQTAYLRSSRQLRRLVAVSRSPMNSLLEETLTGAQIIRAYGFKEGFMVENEEKIEQLQRSQYPEIMSNAWLFLRLQTFGCILVMAASLLVILNRENMEAGLVGFILAYTVNCQDSIYMLTRNTADMEKSIVSVERVKEYMEVEQEVDKVGSLDYDEYGEPSNAWPEKGQITFKRYSTRYRPGLDLVLNGLSCTINSGEKVGIVGRTGAGKSSITLALFRIIEAAEGSISIDDVNIASIGLERLRSALTIIPQDPVLFSGSLRFNMDPFLRHSDTEIKRALSLAHLSSLMNSLPEGLDTVVAEGGGNLSVGQRQLVCLVRALLRRTKVLVLDEATAAVDLETDDLVQETIRREFSQCSVITIAHRLKTIMDSDRVMVLDAGQIKEFSSPASLLKEKKSIFYGMAKDAGLVA